MTSPALELLLVQAAAITSPVGRGLTERETQIIASIFGQGIDASRIRIVRAPVANAPTTLGNQIRVASDLLQDTEEWLSTLVHETAHVWQYQTRGTGYITDSVYHQLTAASDTGTRNAAYFNYRLEEKKSIYDYPAEEQAQIIEDYYDITVRYTGVSNTPDWVTLRRQDLPLYEALIRGVRQSTPLAETAIYERNLMRLPGGQVVDPQRAPDLNIVPLLRIEF